MGRTFKQDGLYVAELDETEWYGDGVDREALKERFKESAVATGCHVLAIFAIPDPLLPMCGKSKKHRVFEYVLPNASKPYTTRALFIAEILLEKFNKLSERDRRLLVREVRDRLNQDANGVPGRYEIRIVGGDDTADPAAYYLAESGRV